MKEEFSNFFEDPLETLEKKDYFLEKMDSNIYIDETAKIKNPVVIEGPVYIGPECEIGPFSYLRPGTYLEGNDHVGNSEIKNSLVLENTNIPHFNYIGDSLIGKDCNFGAGAKVANLRLDEEKIKLRGEKTSRRKLGVVMGSNTKVGINVCFYPGETIKPNSFVYNDLKTGKRIIKRIKNESSCSCRR